MNMDLVTLIESVICSTLKFGGYFPLLVYKPSRKTPTCNLKDPFIDNSYSFFQLDDEPNLYIHGKWVEITKHPSI